VGRSKVTWAVPLNVEPGSLSLSLLSLSLLPGHHKVSSFLCYVLPAMMFCLATGPETMESTD
jgi:hypothetical protein